MFSIPGKDLFITVTLILGGIKVNDEKQWLRVLLLQKPVRVN